MKMFNDKTRGWPLAVISVLVAVLSIAWCVYVLEDGEAQARQAPTTMVGEWHQTGENASSFIATITPGSIEIVMETRDGSSSIYWLGTFNENQDLSKPFEIVSIGDQDAMRSAIFASSEKTKLFSYKDGTLSYKFSMMGTKSVIHLVK